MDNFELFESVLEDYIAIKKKWADENRETGKHFNSLSFFNIQETKHSFLLAYLLNPKEGHGQGSLFLKHFLNKLKMEYHEDDHWVVTAEKGRVDILLKRVNKNPCVIIIENKSNNAQDQPNQLYRYWYREIFLTNKRRKNTILDENARLIYLTPSGDKQASEDTIKRPQGLDESLPRKIPLDVETWYFKKEIYDWLLIAVDEIPKDNHRLREFVKQYMELWN